MGYVFISYSTKNQSLADAMRQLLLQNSIASWMAPADIPAGSKYAQVINRAIKNCSCVVLMLSDAAQNSTWVAKEIERAVSYYKVIIPVQLEEMVLNDEFEFYLSTDQVVALKQFDENQDNVQKLLKIIRQHTENNTKKREIQGYQQTIDANRCDVETKFIDELKQLYEVMTEYRFSLKIGSQTEINRTTTLMMQIVNRIYVFFELYSNTYPDISKKAIEVVNQYNVYAQKFTMFANELKRGYGEESNRLARIAENEFSKFTECVLKNLQFS